MNIAIDKSINVWGWGKMYGMYGVVETLYSGLHHQPTRCVCFHIVKVSRNPIHPIHFQETPYIYL